MFLARVKGHVVSTAKDPSMHGYKLLIVEPLRVDYHDPEHAGSESGGASDAGEKPTTGGGVFHVTGRAIVAIDTIGSGEGQLVLIAQGSSARMAEGMNKVPVDAVVVGIVDRAIVMGHAVE